MASLIDLITSVALLIYMLFAYASEYLAPQFSTVSGFATIMIYGSDMIAASCSLLIPVSLVAIAVSCYPSLRLTAYLAAVPVSYLAHLLQDASAVYIASFASSIPGSSFSTSKSNSSATFVRTAILIGTFHMISDWYETHGCDIAPVDYPAYGISTHWIDNLDINRAVTAASAFVGKALDRIVANWTATRLRTGQDAALVAALQDALHDAQKTIKERDEIIQEFDAAVHGLEARLESLCPSVDEKSHELAERADAIHGLTSKAATAKTALVGLGARVENQAAAILDVTDQLTWARQDIADAESAIIESNARITSLTADLASAHRATADAQKKLSAQDTLVADLNETLDLACESLHEKNQLVKERDKEIGGLNDTLDLACETIHGKNHLVKQRDAEILKLRRQLDEQNAQLVTHARIVEELAAAKDDAKRLQAMVDRRDTELKQKTRALAVCTDQLTDVNRDLQQCETLARMEKSELESHTRSLQNRVDALQAQLSLKVLEIRALADDCTDLEACLEESASTVSRFLRVRNEPSAGPMRSLRARLRWLCRDSQRLLEQDVVIDDDGGDSLNNALQEWNDLLEKAGLVSTTSWEDAWLDDAVEPQPESTITSAAPPSPMVDDGLAVRLRVTCHHLVQERARTEELRTQLDNQGSRLAMCRTALLLASDDLRRLRVIAHSARMSPNADGLAASLAECNAQIATLIFTKDSLELQMADLRADVYATRARNQTLEAELEDQGSRLKLCQAALRLNSEKRKSSKRKMSAAPESAVKMRSEPVLCETIPSALQSPSAMSTRAPLSALSVNVTSHTNLSADRRSNLAKVS